MSFGTTTRSLPKTKIAPALFAVPVKKAAGAEREKLDYQRSSKTE